MKSKKIEYESGTTWTFRRSDGAVKTYIVTKEGNHGSVVVNGSKVEELRYNGKTISK